MASIGIALGRGTLISIILVLFVLPQILDVYKRQVEYFVQKSIANGIDVIRIFDCLNDLRNLECSVKACNKEGGHAQVALAYTLGDAYRCV